MLALGHVIGNVGDADQKVLGEKDGHAVAHVFAGKVLEEQPDEEEEHAGAPIIQDMHHHRAHDDAEPEHDQCLVRYGDDPGCQLPDQPDDNETHDQAANLAFSSGADR